MPDVEGVVHLTPGFPRRQRMERVGKRTAADALGRCSLNEGKAA